MLFQADDPAACAATLASLAGNRQDWEALRERGRAHVRANHDWAVNARRYLPVYQAALDKRPL
jgi:glycosyltransferase involved in cell wall biosynthesis